MEVSRSIYDDSQLLEFAVDAALDKLLDPSSDKPISSQKAFSANISLRKMLNSQGVRGVESVRKEIDTLFKLDTFKPMFFSDIPLNERRNIISSLLFGKEKRCGTLKTRVVGRGDMQKPYEHDSVSSPTVKNGSIMASLNVAAFEDREVGTLDMPAAFAQSELPQENWPAVYMRIGPELSAFIIQDRPELAKYLHNGCLFVRLLKALYGLIESALLWYKNISSHLATIGYYRSEADKCKFFRKDTRCSIDVHVDDLLCCTVKGGFDEIVASCSKKYNGEHGNVTVHRLTEKNSIDYTGMRITKLPNGNGIRVDQTEYLSKLCKQHDVRCCQKFPSKRSFFSVDKNSPRASNPSRFLSVVMALNYASIKTRSDLAVYTGFLATRAKDCSIQDEAKLQHLLQYVNGSLELGITLNPKSMQFVAYIDSSFNVHADAKGQTGIFLALDNGKGFLYAKSAKQKLTGRSSTDTELFAFHTGSPVIIWFRLVFAEFGYPQKSTVVYQDNLSTIALAEKGEGNYGRTKHLALRWFCMKDNLDSGDIVIEHLGTDVMPADNLTKDKHGTSFTRQRDLIHNETLRTTRLHSVFKTRFYGADLAGVCDKRRRAMR